MTDGRFEGRAFSRAPGCVHKATTGSQWRWLSPAWIADGTTEIEDAECVEISYPGFFDQVEALC